MSQLVHIVILFAPQDIGFCDHLVLHLGPMLRQGNITLWHEGMALPGEARVAQLDEHLARANLLLPLISADLLNLPAHLTRIENAVARNLHVVPVLVRASDWQGLQVLNKRTPLPADGRPVDLWPNVDAAWLAVLQGLNRVIARTKHHRRASRRIFGLGAIAVASMLLILSLFLRLPNELEVTVKHEEWNRMLRFEVARVPWRCRECWHEFEGEASPNHQKCQEPYTFFSQETVGSLAFHCDATVYAGRWNRRSSSIILKR